MGTSEREERARRAQGRVGQLRSSARYGRLRARLPRWAFVGFITMMSIAGAHSILVPPKASAPPPTFASPDFAEQSFAVAFARAYLSYDGAEPERREAALSRFVNSSMEGNAGFEPPPAGSQHVQWAEVAQVQRPLAGGTIITVAAKVTSSEEPVYLSVPVRRGHGAVIFLAGYPAFVGPPLTTKEAVLEPPRDTVSDPILSTVVKRALSNYLAGDGANFSADLAKAATVSLPSNHLRLSGIEELLWVAHESSGAVLATVTAVDEHGGLYTLRYEVGVQPVEARNPEIGAGWRVTYMQAISQQP